MTLPPPPTPPGWYPDPSGGGGQRYWDGTAWGPALGLGSPQPARSIQAAEPPQKKSVWLKSAFALLIGAAVATGLFVVVDSLLRQETSSSSGDQSSSISSRTNTLSPQEIERRQAAERARLDPATYRAITPRDFALIAKDPDAHKGEKIIVYGVVTQFDAATGKEGFRADTGAAPQSSAYEFDQNTIIESTDTSILKDVVEKDFVTMWVEVAGSYSYDTQLGGNTTVPKFYVNVIEVTGSSG